MQKFALLRGREVSNKRSSSNIGLPGFVLLWRKELEVWRARGSGAGAD